MRPSPIIIIGAGISGLAVAWALKKRGADVLVLETHSFAGGAIQSVRQEGYLCERGPNTILLSHPKTAELLGETGLLDAALDASPHAKKRYVVQNGKLAPLPSSPPAFFVSPALSWRAKLRIFRDLWIPPDRDENITLAHFVRRRLGEEPLRELVDPFVSGVYAGDPERLVVRHALPELYQMEQTHGSLIRGTFHLRREKAFPRRLISWPGGLSDLAKGLAKDLEGCIRFSTPVQSLERSGKQFRIVTPREKFEAERVVIAADAISAAGLLSPIFPGATSLSEMPHAPIGVIHLGFSRASIGHPLDGFGVLISRARRIRTLGALFSSALFPGRAPEGRVLLTIFIGGRLDPEAIRMDDTALVQTALKDMVPLLQISRPPVFQQVTRWSRAIPQYERDHPLMIKICEEAEKAFPGLHLIGNYRGGISLDHCIVNGARLAAGILGD